MCGTQAIKTQQSDVAPSVLVSTEIGAISITHTHQRQLSSTGEISNQWEENSTVFDLRATKEGSFDDGGFCW
jgi:hypothetical protein